MGVHCQWFKFTMNSLIVGRNQKRVLNHDDEISLATKKNKGSLNRRFSVTVRITLHTCTGTMHIM